MTNYDENNGGGGQPPPSAETQLAVIRIKLDQLMELNKTRGEDHEQRIRKLEERRFPLQNVAALMSVAAIMVAIIMPLISR